jgi:alkanesulfonate monooxygenase
VIVRETEEEARAYADGLLSKLDLDLGTDIRNRAQDAASLGVMRQSQLREEADEKYYVEPHLWTGIGLARSGCGAAIVGNPDQVVAKLERYMEMGIRSFILSGYPHKQECELFAKHVLPRIKTVSFPEVFGRIPQKTPNSPLANGPRK